MTLLIDILLVIYVLVAVLMVLVILMQRPKSEGLGAAFGGGVTENIFGAQTTNVLTKFTTWLATIFFVLTFALSILYAHRSVSRGGLREELMKGQPSAALSPTPSPGPSSAVGAPGTVTNPTPAAAQAAATASARPSDMAVGAVPAGGPVATPLPSAKATASPQP